MDSNSQSKSKLVVRENKKSKSSFVHAKIAFFSRIIHCKKILLNLKINLKF